MPGMDGNKTENTDLSTVEGFDLLKPVWSQAVRGSVHLPNLVDEDC
jgi:hypothetical protein